MHNKHRTFLPKKTSKSFYATLHIAGNYNQAENLCRQWVMKGACVQISPCTYVYTGGVEDGMTVRIMQYPRFERPEHEILDMAVELGSFLAQELCQISFSVETPYNTTYYQAEGYEKRS